MADESNEDREEGLAEKALNDQPNRETSPDEPWAKTSSGDADTITPEDDE
jgi:hypothetical protein